MGRRGLEALDHLRGGQGVGHHGGGQRERAGIEGFGGGLKHVAAVEHAHDLVGAAVAQGQARAARDAEPIQDRRARLLRLGDLDLAPGGHQPARGAVGEAHDAGDHLGLGALHHARALGLGDHHADLLVADPVLAPAGSAEKREDRPPRAVEEPDEGRRPDRERPHRGGHARRDGLGPGEGDLLRNEFARDQREVGDRQHDETDAKAIREARRHPERGQGVREARAERGAREGARQDPHEGDADLDRGEEPPRILGKAKGHRRAALAAFGPDLQARGARGDHRELGHGEHPVEGDQREDDGDLEEHGSALKGGVRRRRKGRGA